MKRRCFIVSKKGVKEICYKCIVLLPTNGTSIDRCLAVRNKEGKVKRYPLFENEISEIRIKSGNIVSVIGIAANHKN